MFVSISFIHRVHLFFYINKKEYLKNFCDRSTTDGVSNMLGKNTDELGLKIIGLTLFKTIVQPIE